MFFTHFVQGPCIGSTHLVFQQYWASCTWWFHISPEMFVQLAQQNVCGIPKFPTRLDYNDMIIECCDHNWGMKTIYLDDLCWGTSLICSYVHAVWGLWYAIWAYILRDFLRLTSFYNFRKYSKSFIHFHPWPHPKLVARESFQEWPKRFMWAVISSLWLVGLDRGLYRII